jgi:hypothetical protein
MKNRLVLRPNEFSSFTSWYLESFWNQFFEIEIYDLTTTYDKKHTIFIVWWMNADDDPWCKEMRDRGYKIAVDNLWEPMTGRSDFYWIEHKFSMRWNESLWWRALGYESYRPNKNLQYRAFMQIRSQKPDRDLIIDCFKNSLDSMLWSYVARNKRLPHDTNDELQGQRYFHPSWYDQTYCSMVIETYQEGILHVSEKSYKPIAYFHPYMIASVAGSLDRLREQGFLTFDNIFDESYDTEPNLLTRLLLIRDNLNRIDFSQGYDTETMARLQHNHDLFFDVELVKKTMTQEIVLPLLAYAET